MKIAILGTRGVPANYGGFETFAEELSKILAAKDHKVTVYSRTRELEAMSKVSLFCPGNSKKAVLVNSMTIAANVHSALFSIAAYTVILCFALFKTGGLAKQVFNAH